MANLNRLLNRPAVTSIVVPTEIQPVAPDWTLDALRQTAWEHQPDIAAAQLRAHAASWGVRVAELERRPDVTLNLDWMVMSPQKEPGMPAFGGQDSVQIGAMVNVPLWHEKYDAMRDEAVRDSVARRFSLADVQRQYEAMIAELLEQARAASRTASLYTSTMLPQARQTFEADQRAYVGPGTVEFDRVVEDFRTVLTLEEGYHRAIGEWAIAVARIEQAVARDPATLMEQPELLPPVDDGAEDSEPMDEARKSPTIQLMSDESASSTHPLAHPSINADQAPQSHAGRSADHSRENRGAGSVAGGLSRSISAGATAR
jgi:outer membrane protein TolC